MKAINLLQTSFHQFFGLILLNEQEKKASITTVGLRELSDEDIELISEETLKLVRKQLGKKVPQGDIDEFDIVIDIDNSGDSFRVEIDIGLHLPPRLALNEEQVIRETLEVTFSELDKLLKEKFSH